MAAGLLVTESPTDSISMAHSMVIDEYVGDWYVLHTKTCQEKMLASSLRAMDIAFYLPLIKRIRYFGRQKCTVVEPLFPNYIFLRGSIEEAYEADRTKRVIRVIAVADQDQINREIRSFHLALTHQAPLDLYPYLKKGIWVEVRSGPFQGVQGLIESRYKDDRLILQIDVLGRAASLEIDGTLLDPIG